MVTELYSVFPACGKTWLHRNQETFGIKVLDSDSSLFSWIMSEGGDKVRNPEFPKNYVDYIQERLHEGKFNYIFVSSHEEVRSALSKAGIEYFLVYPARQLKSEWEDRVIKREQNMCPFNVIHKNWDSWIDSCNEDAGAAVKIILSRPNMYLTDILPDKPLRYKAR